MARDSINVQYPAIDTTQSVGKASVTKTAVNASNGIKIASAFANKNNTLIICVDNDDDADSYVVFKAGDAYPNAMLGDLQQTVLSETTTVFQLQDISRFENKDGSLNVDFKTGFDGTIYAIAKSVALNS